MCKLYTQRVTKEPNQKVCCARATCVRQTKRACVRAPREDCRGKTVTITDIDLEALSFELEGVEKMAKILTIRGVDGRSFDLTAQKGDTISAVKTIIAAMRGIPRDKQKLMYAGKLLDNTAILDDISTTISLTLDLHGGSPKSIIKTIKKVPMTKQIMTKGDEATIMAALKAAIEVHEAKPIMLKSRLKKLSKAQLKELVQYWKHDKSTGWLRSLSCLNTWRSLCP